MNKTQRRLENIILAQREDLERLHDHLDTESKLVETLTAQATATDKLYKRLSDQEKARHAAEKKAATEAATLKSIREGFVPIAVLRDLTGAEYTTEHCQSFTKTNLTVMLNAAKPVDKAILAALLEKPKDALGYATGGFTGVRFDDTVDSSLRAHLHYNPSIFAPGVVA